MLWEISGTLPLFIVSKLAPLYLNPPCRVEQSIESLLHLQYQKLNSLKTHRPVR